MCTTGNASASNQQNGSVGNMGNMGTARMFPWVNRDGRERMYALTGSPDNPPKPDVLLRYEVTYDRMFKSALRHLESLTRHRKPSVGPFPAHPSGHNWKDEPEPSPEDHGADLASEQEPARAAHPNPLSDPQNRDHQGADSPTASQPSNAGQQLPRQKIPHAIRPQEVVETKPRQKDGDTPKQHRTMPFKSSPPKPAAPSSKLKNAIMAVEKLGR